MEMLGKGPRSPTVLPTGTPRGEELLQNENRKQRSRIVDLERKIAEQEALIVAADHRRPIPGGTCSVHLSQAYAHVGQAISVACSGVTSCFVASKPESETLLNKKKPATVNAKMGRNAQSFIPDWYNGVEKHAKKVGGPLERRKSKGSMSEMHAGALSNRAKQTDILEDDEYLLEDEWDEADTYVFNPRSKWKETWDMGVLLFILYSAVVIPFRICFSAEAVGWMWDFEVFVSLFFIVDVIFNFNTSYNIEDKWVISRSRITMNYLSGWFWIDAPSSLPVELMTAFMDNESSSQLSLLRFLRMFRLLRLLRLLKVEKYVSMLEDKFEVNLVSLRVLGMVTRLLFMVHMLGCFWFYCAAQAEEAGEEVTWVTTYDGGSAHDGPVSKQYIYSVYWSLTTLTTVGYGDITPTNMIERCYCLFAMLIGAMMFGYMMSTIGSMVTTMDRQAAAFEEKMDKVKEWMTTRNIPRKLLIRVRKYYEHYYTRKSAFDEEDIVRGLTPALRAEVTSILLRDSLGHFPLLNVLGVEFQQEVYPRLKPVSYANQDVIYPKGSVSEDIFFLRKGTCDVLAGGPGTNVLYRINPGQYFGEEALTHERRGCSILANGWCELWSLSRDVLDETIEKFPELQPKLEKFLIADLERKSRLYKLSYRILIGMAQDEKQRNALIIQKVWTQFSTNRARAESRYPKHAAVVESFTPSKTRTRSRASTSNILGGLAMPARETSNEGLAAALRQIQGQLVSMKQEMKEMRSGPSAPSMASPLQRAATASRGFVMGASRAGAPPTSSQRCLQA